MHRFPIYCVPKCAIQSSGYQDVQKRQGCIFLYIHCELDVWCIHFKCSRNPCNASFLCGHTTQVLSTYLYQWIGLFIAVKMAVFLRCSVVKFTTTGAKGDAMATLSFCLKNDPSYRKYVVLGTCFMRFTVCLWNSCWSICSVPSSGTLVNSETTPKLTNMSISCKVIECIVR